MGSVRGGEEGSLGMAKGKVAAELVDRRRQRESGAEAEAEAEERHDLDYKLKQNT